MATLLPNDPIVRIPEKLLMTRSSVYERLPVVSNFKLTTAEVLSVFLLHCRDYKENTAYLSMLPKDFPVAALCTTEEVALLPEYLKEAVLHSMGQLEEKYEKIRAIWKSVFNKDLSQEMFNWAWFAVNTRAVYLEELHDGSKQYGPENNLALAPYLDMLNHDSKASISAKFNSTLRSYEISTLQKISSFSQVFINYGPHDNTKLFIEYGFIVPDNIHCIVELEQEFCEKLSLRRMSVKGQKRKFIKQLFQNKNVFCNRQGFSCDAELVLTILSLDEAILQELSTPYEVSPVDTAIASLGVRTVETLLEKYRQDYERARTTNMNHQTESFSVAIALMAEKVKVLEACLLNYV